MAVRSLRRSFAAPFVITLALPACGAPPAERVLPNVNPPRPQPTFEERRWRVFKVEELERCEAQILVPCDPNIACNPPRPVVYECLDNQQEVTIKRVSATECVLESIPTTKVPCPKD